jgi:hypothetical protein
MDVSRLPWNAQGKVSQFTGLLANVLVNKNVTASLQAIKFHSVLLASMARGLPARGF